MKSATILFIAVVFFCLAWEDTQPKAVAQCSGLTFSRQQRAVRQRTVVRQQTACPYCGRTQQPNFQFTTRSVNPICGFFGAITEPFVRPFRRMRR